MDFYDIVRQVLEQLQRNGRTTYRALKRQFNLNDEALEDLKEEPLFAYPVVDQDGRGLFWTGDPAQSKPDVQHGTDSETRFQVRLRAVMWQLQYDGRVTYRTLQHTLGLDDTLLQEIREELTLRQLAVDEAGKVLVWMDASLPTTPPSVSIPSRPATAESTAVTSPTASALPQPVIATPTPSQGATASPQIHPVDAPQGEMGSRPEITLDVPEGERRHATVVFSDLSGYTMMGAKLDPEEVESITSRIKEKAVQIVERHGGIPCRYGRPDDS